MKRNGAATAAGIISFVLGLAVFAAFLYVLMLHLIGLFFPLLLSAGLLIAGVALLSRKARAAGIGLILCAVSWLFLSVRFLFTDPGVLSSGTIVTLALAALSPALPLGLSAAFAFARGKFKKLWFLPPALLAAEYLVFAVWTAATGFIQFSKSYFAALLVVCAAAALIALFLCCLWLGGIEDGENGAYSS